jgi:mannose-6-phosphate isomerase-like protein (cupin superfamily)
MEVVRGDQREPYTASSEGQGRMRLASEEAEVRAGDAVVIPPGTRHKPWNTGDRPLVLLCCSAPLLA